jgi:AcrR family transcriptional regulator
MLADRAPHETPFTPAPAWLIEGNGRKSLPEGAGSIDRLLLAALQSFSEYGYHGTTTRVITERADLSPAALYIYFQSKSEILGRLIHDIHLYIRAELERVVVDASGPVPQLEAFVRRHLKFHIDTPSAARVANFELESLEADDRDRVLVHRHAIDKLVSDILVRGAKAGTFDVSDVEIVRTALLSLTIDVSRWAHLARRSPDIATLGDIYWQLVSRMVGAPRS